MAFRNARILLFPTILAVGLSGCATVSVPVPPAPPQSSAMTSPPVRPVTPQILENRPVIGAIPQSQSAASEREAHIAQARGIWQFAMVEDRPKAVACLSSVAGATASTSASRSAGGSQWVYRNGRYVRERPVPTHTDPQNDEDSACIRFSRTLTDQETQMRAVSAPLPVLRYFRAAQSWALSCAESGSAVGGCSSHSALSDLSQKKAEAEESLGLR